MGYYHECENCNAVETVDMADPFVSHIECDVCGSEGCRDCMAWGLCDTCQERRDREDADDAAAENEDDEKLIDEY